MSLGVYACVVSHSAAHSMTLYSFFLLDFKHGGECAPRSSALCSRRISHSSDPKGSERPQQDGCIYCEYRNSANSVPAAELMMLAVISWRDERDGHRKPWYLKVICHARELRTDPQAAYGEPLTTAVSNSTAYRVRTAKDRSQRFFHSSSILSSPIKRRYAALNSLNCLNVRN